MRLRQVVSGHRFAVIIVIALGLWSGFSGIVEAQESPTTAEIREMIEGKSYDEAERALAAAGDDEALTRLRAELYRKTDRIDLAYREYQRVVAADPDDTGAHFWLATIDRWRGRQDQALAGYTRVLELSECHHDALTGRARVYQSLERYEEAKSDLRNALSCHPDDEEASGLLAGLLAREGRQTEAQVLLRQAFSGADLERRLGDMELDARNAAAARAHYRAALALRPDDPSLIEKLADAERVLDNNATALELYEQSAALAGDSGNLYWIGLLALRLDRLERAEAAFDEKLQEEPDDSGALIGKARVRRAQGRFDEALGFVNRALERNPTNGEALVLRGALQETIGRRRDARSDYFAALQRNATDSDARLLFDRIGPPAFFTLSGRSSRSRGIEGLEDEGLIVDGVPIRPARIEYINDSVTLETGVQVGSRTALDGIVSGGREAVRNGDTGRMIYDFDVLTATGGLNHQLTNQWRLSWRVGGTRYEPRSELAIDTSDRFRGGLELAYNGASYDVELGYSRRPFIQRGFATDTQFSIFDEDRLSVSWGRNMGRGMSVRFSTAVSSFEESETPVSGGVTVRWDRGGNAFFVRAGHDPFPSRYLGPDQTLEFIDFDGVTVGLKRELGAGFRLAGDATYGRYEETRRDEVLDGVRIEGPMDNNTARRADVELAWSPRPRHPFALGGAYEYENWDFRTSPYNTRNTNDRSVFARLEDQDSTRLRYLIHVSHHWISDDRSADVYDSNVFVGNLDLRLGKFPRERGSYWLGFEGLYDENDLDEERYRFRMYLTVPF